ncbi:MAG: hypothetical protein Q8L48_19670 [Archangium sp.]|nr:hypothetical protein [Archangium sp.]
MKISRPVTVKPQPQITRLPGRPLPGTITRPPGGCFPIPFPFPGGEKVTLSLKDRFNAARLPGALQQDLSGLKGTVKLAMAPDATLRRGKDGTMRGPEGQPLVPVTLKDGKTAYVDPNTNQYYVDENKLRYFRSPDSISVKGPLPLPEGVEFSNSHFSDADCRALSRVARDGIFKKDDFQPIRPKNPVLF